MKKFRNIVAIDPVGLVPSAIERLRLLADEVVMSGDVPADTDETVRRIGDADGALLSSQCPSLFLIYVDVIKDKSFLRFFIG